MTGMPSVPLISVVIPSYNARGTIRQCLRSVLDQDLEAGYELIVVDSSSDGTDRIIRQEFSGALLLRSEGRLSAAEARNQGVKNAVGAFVAFTDADCVVPRDWLRRILRRHQEGDYAAVGGSVANGTPGSLTGSAEHLLQFNEFLRANSARLMTSIPTCNLCYRASVLAETPFEGGPPGSYLLAEDLLLNWRLVRRGAKILFDPEIQVLHLHRTSLRAFLGHQYLVGRSSCWARKRADLPGHLFAAYPLLGAALPALRFARIGLRLCRLDRRLTLRFLGLSPLILLGVSVWSAGFIREAIRGNLG
jgi:glycosyltransferase involved in cell wall biosynthesis